MMQGTVFVFVITIMMIGGEPYRLFEKECFKSRLGNNIYGQK